MRAVGVDEIAEPDIISHNLCGGRVLLCSDGLSGSFHFDDSYKNILTDMTDPENTVNRLIEYANRCGGSDNITAVIIRLQS
ncbi:Protein phosphatase PrpC [bioreactor metagenome]|uniref:Protein phosphatase PrpC n=1 Tax=bioreactor metagenome TaxID=1076179 RepID=A0A645HMX5_9ZZZZ